MNCHCFHFIQTTGVELDYNEFGRRWRYPELAGKFIVATQQLLDGIDLSIKRKSFVYDSSSVEINQPPASEVFMET